jgi:hypothetical protein
MIASGTRSLAGCGALTLALCLAAPAALAHTTVRSQANLDEACGAGFDALGRAASLVAGARGCRRRADRTPS